MYAMCTRIFSLDAVNWLAIYPPGLFVLRRVSGRLVYLCVPMYTVHRTRVCVVGARPYEPVGRTRIIIIIVYSIIL